jgi:hypothetical protein
MKITINDERSIKHLKETIDSLKKENTKLKAENKTVSSLKEAILKLQEEKMELSRKLMEMESEAVLYKDGEDINDEMLYNPRRGSRLSTISQKEALLKLQANQSNINIPNKEQRVFNSDLNKITNENFSLITKKNTDLLNDSLKNKNEEIILLKNELVKKEQIITELKKNIEKNKISSSKLSFNTSFNNSKILRPINDDSNKKSHKTEDYLDLLSRKYSIKRNYDNKEVNDSIYDENEAHLLLEKNIYSEIQNILEEKRNFILKTLTCENFSFDIINNNEKKKNKETIEGEISGGSIEQILCLIRQRKRKVELTKKYLEEKII